MALKQIALRMGFISGTEQMSIQAKSAATLVTILQQTSKQYGTLAPAMDNPIGRLRQMHAAVKDAAESLGNLLMPAAMRAMGGVRDLGGLVVQLVAAFSGLPGPVQATVGALAGVALVAGPLVLLLGKLLQAAAAVTGLGTAFVALRGLVAAIGADFAVAGLAATGFTATLLGVQAAAMRLAVAAGPVLVLAGALALLGAILHNNAREQQLANEAEAGADRDTQTSIALTQRHAEAIKIAAEHGRDAAHLLASDWAAATESSASMAASTLRCSPRASAPDPASAAGLHGPVLGHGQRGREGQGGRGVREQAARHRRPGPALGSGL